MHDDFTRRVLFCADHRKLFSHLSFTKIPIVVHFNITDTIWILFNMTFISNKTNWSVSQKCIYYNN